MDIYIYIHIYIYNIHVYLDIRRYVYIDLGPCSPLGTCGCLLLRDKILVSFEPELQPSAVRPAADDPTPHSKNSEETCRRRRGPCKHP